MRSRKLNTIKKCKEKSRKSWQDNFKISEKRELKMEKKPKKIMRMSTK